MMRILLYILFAIGVIIALGSKLFGGTKLWVSMPADDEEEDGATGDATANTHGDCSACTGDNERCMHDCMMEAAVNDVEYFDDEELDDYRGRAADAYTDDEAEEFREVMLTMRPDEVAAWSRSLALRGVEPPDQIKDEMVMLIDG